MCALAHVHEGAHGQANSMFGLRYYNTAAAPANIASETKPAESTAAGFGRHARTPPDEDPKVAANCAVGFGPPLTVTVGLEVMGGMEELLEPESTMENACEVAYMMPCVLLRKRRK